MELVEVRGDHLKRSDIARLASGARIHARAPQNQPGQLRLLPNIGGQSVRFRRFEQMDHALLNVAAPFAVAAPRALHHAVDARERPVHNGEIDVDAGLHQTRSNHAASLAALKPPPDLLQHALAMDGMHERRKMERALGAIPGHQIVEPLRLLAAVHDAKHLLVRRQPGGEISVFDRSLKAVGNPSQPLVQPLRVGGDLPHRAAIAFEQPVERRLRRRAEYDRAIVALHKLRQRPHAGKQLLRRQHLRLVEHDHAARNVVQLAAARGLVREQRLEELDIRRHHHGRVPILGRKPQRIAVLARVVEVEVRMVFKHVALAEHLAEHGGVLLDDRGVGHRVDHTAHAVALGERVAQREAQRRVRLAAARRHREREHTRSLLGRAGARIEQAAPRFVELGLRRVEGRDLRLKALAQRIEPFGRKLLARAAPHETLRAEEVRIHQAGEHHPRKERQREAVFRIGRHAERKLAGDRQLNFVGERMVVGQFPLARPIDAAQQRGAAIHIRRRASIR